MTMVDDSRWMTADGSREMDHGRRMTINILPLHEDIEVIRGYTLVENSYYDSTLRSFNQAQIRRFKMYCWRYGSSEYDTDHDSEHYSEIPNHAPTCPSTIPNTIPNQIPSYSNNADTAHLEAIYD